MRELSLIIAVKSGSVGFMEVEFIRLLSGQLTVLEINPRICGTLRISAMASSTPVFSLATHANQMGHLAATSASAEVPFSGLLPYAPPRGVFATTRITVADRSFRKVLAQMKELQLAGCRIDKEAMSDFSDLIGELE